MRVHIPQVEKFRVSGTQSPHGPPGLRPVAVCPVTAPWAVCGFSASLNRINIEEF